MFVNYRIIIQFPINAQVLTTTTGQNQRLIKLETTRKTLDVELPTGTNQLAKYWRFESCESVESTRSTRLPNDALDVQRNSFTGSFLFPPFARNFICTPLTYGRTLLV